MSAKRSVYVVALDAGTGGGRCLITDLEGRFVASAHERWSYTVAEGTDALGHELDPGLFWRKMGEVVRHAMKAGVVSPDRVAAVSATSQRLATVCLDSEGRELYGGPNYDARGFPEGSDIESEFGDKLYEITGHGPPWAVTLSRLLWFRGHRPELYGRIAHVLSLSDWLLYRLCGEAATEPSIAGGTMCFDIRRRTWSNEILDLFELPKETFPPVRTAGEVLGKVTESAAEVLGLRPGTAVVIGGGDTQCGLLGVGAIDAGETVAIAGTTTPVQMVLDEPVIDPKHRLWTGCHLLPERWTLESNAYLMGELYLWVRDAFVAPFFPGETDPERLFEKMEALAGEAPPGANGTRVFLGSEVMDKKTMGLPKPSIITFPTRATLILESPPLDIRHIIRATLEGFAYAVRGNVEQAAEVSRRPVEKLLVAGGLSRSRLWLQILADVLGVTVARSSIAEGSTLGAAVCAAVGSGAYSDLGEGGRKMASVDAEFAPNPENRDEYRSQYERWRELVERANQIA